MVWAGGAAALVRRYVVDGVELYSQWGVGSLSNRHRLLNNHGITEPWAISGDARCAGFVPLSPLTSGNPSNWQGPVWIVNNYLLFRGLVRYGHRGQAEALFERTGELLERDIERTGTTYPDPRPTEKNPLTPESTLRLRARAALMTTNPAPAGSPYPTTAAPRAKPPSSGHSF